MADYDRQQGPVDYNRKYTPPRVPQEVSPGPLRWAYWILVVAAVVMLCAGFIGIFGTGAEPVEEPGAVKFNRYLLAGTNIIGAIVFSLVSPQLAQGSKLARRIITGTAVVVLFVVVAGFLIGVSGFFLIIIPVLLAAALLMMFRPSSNDYIAKKAGDPTWD
ncbi:hypothetical protein AALI21_01950 [Corynebacteriaceae bacterium 6-324]